MPRQPRFASRPEAAIQEDIIEFMQLRGWLVEVTHGNVYQAGLPDLFCWNERLDKFRWIDVKNPSNYRFTAAQCKTWTEWEKHGLGVWIMVGANEEEYAKLFQPANMRDYWRPSYDQYLLTIEEVIAPIVEKKSIILPGDTEANLLSFFLDS